MPTWATWKGQPCFQRSVKYFRFAHPTHGAGFTMATVRARRSITLCSSLELSNTVDLGRAADPTVTLARIYLARSIAVGSALFALLAHTVKPTVVKESLVRSSASRRRVNFGSDSCRVAVFRPRRVQSSFPSLGRETLSAAKKVSSTPSPFLC